MVGDEIIGIGRYDQLDDPHSAEVAFNISDHYHGKGVGSVLLEHLAAIAQDPLLPEVAWSWLTESLEASGAGFHALGGTVTATSSTRFGDIAGPQRARFWSAGWSVRASRPMWRSSGSSWTESIFLMRNWHFIRILCWKKQKL